MAQVATDGIEPAASPPSPAPETDPLTPAQWRTLMAFADTIVPDIKVKGKGAKKQIQLGVPDGEYSTALKTLRDQSSQSDREAVVKAYLSERPSQSPAFRETLWRFLSLYISQDAKRQLTMVFNLLDTRAGALVLTGSPTPFADQPVYVREQILQNWVSARLPPIRMLAKSIAMLIKRSWVLASPTINDVLDFPRMPVHGTRANSYPYEFLQFTDVDAIETDVVIVGSGCGGGVAAKNIAEAGCKVIVVEMGYHWSADHFPMTQSDGSNNLFMSGTAILSDDQNVGIAAASTFGGGGTINWSASLQTQGYVRREWSHGHNLPFFTSAEFQTSLDRVCDRMGVSAEHIEHNKTNRVLLEGARKLGWTHKPVPQNTGGAKHYCGYCHLGCPSCEKQGPTVTYLRDAAEKGAQFVEGFDAREILFEKRGDKQVATGVKGVWTSRDSAGGLGHSGRVQKDVVIRAKKVVVGAGTMQSPLLLKRSGLRNPNIGRNLRLHPVSLAGAIFPEDIKPWEGGILTAVVSEFENLDGKGHGVKLEATNMLPATFLGFIPWRSGLEFKLGAARLRNMTGYISIARDTGSGQVYPDPADGRPRFKFNPTAADRRHIVEGLIGLAKILYVEGAEEIFTMIPTLPPFKRASPSVVSPGQDGDDGINDPAFNSWLDSVRRAGLTDADNMFFSAHQMGTCKMGTQPKSSVVDPKGKVWGTSNVWVMDASVFPSASGVNPMLTNMAISDWTSRQLVKEMRRDGSGRGGIQEESRL